MVARGFWPELPRGVPTVAVFRDQTLEEVERALRLVRPDFLQFHGFERPGFCRVFERPVIRALPARVPADLAVAEAFADIAEFFLVDLPKGDAGTLPADVARAAMNLPKPVLLAGGLNPGNVRRDRGAVPALRGGRGERRGVRAGGQGPRAGAGVHPQRESWLVR